jgi:hypothetical protein
MFFGVEVLLFLKLENEGDKRKFFFTERETLRF